MGWPVQAHRTSPIPEQGFWGTTLKVVSANGKDRSWLATGPSPLERWGKALTQGTDLHEKLLKPQILERRDSLDASRAVKMCDGWEHPADGLVFHRMQRGPKP